MRKYRLAVRQLVLYLGEGSSVMPREIQEEGLHFSYTLSSIQHYDASDLLMSEVPEEILLAILCNFGKDRPEEIIKKLLQRLQQLVKSPRILQRYIRQLSVLSQLRNLREVTVQQIKVMEFPYDIQKDFLYREGKAEGREEGKAEGREEGKAEGREEGKAESKKQIIIRMLLSGHLTIAQIASFTGESEDDIEVLQKKIKAKRF
jgi:predicted transposase YdaD